MNYANRIVALMSGIALCLVSLYVITILAAIPIPTSYYYNRLYEVIVVNGVTLTLPLFCPLIGVVVGNRSLAWSNTASCHLVVPRGPPRGPNCWIYLLATVSRSSGLLLVLGQLASVSLLAKVLLGAFLLLELDNI